MAKKKKEKLKIEIEDKYIEKYLPHGLMLGVTIGSILSMCFNDVLFIIYGICGGMLIAVIMGTCASEKKSQNKKKKTTKKK